MRIKLTALIVSVLLCLSCFAQQSLISVSGWNAYIHLPSDYSTTTKTYPTIIFFPGEGETATNASAVISNGVGAYITQGWNGNVGNVSFIVVSLQPSTYWARPATVQPYITWLKNNYRIDPTNVILTGLSMGGYVSSMFVSGDPIGSTTYAGQIKAIVTVEGVKPDDNPTYPNGFKNFAAVGGKVLCFEQAQDGRDGQTVVNTMNTARAGSAQYITTTFGNSGHCCWSSFYGGGGTAPSTFNIFGTTQNIYQWMASIVTPQVVTPSPVINSSSSITGTMGTQLTYNITATNSPISYSATGLPTGLSINTTLGTIVGTPTVTGTFNINISATNSGGTGTATLVMTIAAPAPTIKQTITIDVYTDGSTKIH